MIASDERRGEPREAAGWNGEYRLTLGRDEGWHPCAMVDIAEHGAAFLLDGPTPAPDDGIVVRLFDRGLVAGDPAGEVQLSGRVVDVTAAPASVRVGVQIDHLDLEQRDGLLRLLSHQLA